MKYSVFFEHISRLAEENSISLIEASELTGRMGYTCADISRSETEAPGVLKACGMGVNSIYGFFDLGRSDDLSEAMLMIDRAAELRAAALIVPGFLDEADAAELKSRRNGNAVSDYLSSNPETVRMRAALGKLSVYGTKANVNVMIENFDSHTSPIERIEEIAWFLEGCPELDYNLDTGNYAFADEDALDAARRFLLRIRAVHLKDRRPGPGSGERTFNRGMGACAVGSGYIPIKRILEIVLPAHPDCSLSAEHFGANNWECTLKESIAFIKSVT